MNATTKSPFASGSILGGLVASLFFLVAGQCGFHLDKAQTLGVLDALWQLKPMIVGIAGALVVMWSRLSHLDFSRINWPGVAGGVLTLLAALGIDTSDLQHVSGDVSEVTARAPGVLAGVVMIWRVLSAKAVIDTRRATPLSLWLLPLCLCLANCSAWSRLSPETQARIEAKAVAAATAAATSAAQGVLDGKGSKQIARDAGKAALEAVQLTEVSP